MQNIATEFLAKYPELKKIEFIYVDINGIPRGKVVLPINFKKAFAGGLKIPISSYILDIWGDNPSNIDIVNSGDADGICEPVVNSLAIMPWDTQVTAQCLLSTKDINGKALFADPRQVLQSVLARFYKLGLKPVMAPEIEFYLIDKKLKNNTHPQMPIIKGTNRRYRDVQLLNLSEIDDFEDFFTLVKNSAQALNIPIESIVKECSPGQFEINLHYSDDVLLMADHTFLLKRMLKKCAQKYDLNVTFMAKPFSNKMAGNGMHVHLSIIDNKGSNVFIKDLNDIPQGIFANVIAGIMKTTLDFFAFYAPHANSYRRMMPDYKASAVPTTLSWGRENRTALIRLPTASPEANRLEFRVISADANPYLAFAAILAGALEGIDKKYTLGKETIGNAHTQYLQKLNISWQQAVDNSGNSKIVEKFFGKELQKVYTQIKQTEIDKFAVTVTDFEYNTYLRCI